MTVNNELKMIRWEAGVAKFKAISQHLFGGAGGKERETRRDFRDLNLGIRRRNVDMLNTPSSLRVGANSAELPKQTM
jgi:hypothetical protein